MEFGSRRAQGADGAIMGARAAYIGGCVGTACTIVDRDMHIPALGTRRIVGCRCSPARKKRSAIMPLPIRIIVHCWWILIMCCNPACQMPIKVFQEEIVPRGFRPKGVRIDSGDIAYLSKKVRVMLDEAGFKDCGIVASNSLDEYIIRDI